MVTCNYVARERGVKKMMSIKEAKDICPEIVIVSGEDLTHYREMSYRITGMCTFSTLVMMKFGCYFNIHQNYN